MIIFFFFFFFFFFFGLFLLPFGGLKRPGGGVCQCDFFNDSITSSSLRASPISRCTSRLAGGERMGGWEGGQRGNRAAGENRNYIWPSLCPSPIACLPFLSFFLVGVSPPRLLRRRHPTYFVAATLRVFLRRPRPHLPSSPIRFLLSASGKQRPALRLLLWPPTTRPDPKEKKKRGRGGGRNLTKANKPIRKHARHTHTHTQQTKETMKGTKIVTAGGGGDEGK
jgi:hypothetical protein